MTELQIASAIQNYVTAREGITDSMVDLEQIRDEVDTLRMRLIQEMGKQRALIPEAYYQTLKGDRVKPTLIKTGTFKGWSEVKIPRIYTNLKGKPQIQYIGPAGELEPNRVVTGNQHIYIKAERFTDQYPLVFYDVDRVLFREAYPKIVVKALFEDPSKLEIYDCYDHERDDYPAPQGDIDHIIGKTAESYLRTEQFKVILPNVQTDTPKRG